MTSTEIVIAQNASNVPFHVLVKDHYSSIAEHGPLHATLHAKQRGQLRRIYVSALKKRASVNVMVDVVIHSPNFEVVVYKQLALQSPTSRDSFLSYVDVPNPQFVMMGEEVTIEMTMTDGEVGNNIDVVVDQREPFIPLFVLVA